MIPIGKIEKIFHASGNADGIEFDVQLDNGIRRISPRNLSEIGVCFLKAGETPFSSELVRKLIASKVRKARLWRAAKLAEHMQVLFNRNDKDFETTLVVPPPFRDFDLATCLAWAGGDVSTPKIENLFRLTSEYHVWRLLSARAAELVAAKYYRRQGYEVEDTSVLQVGRKDERWKTYDLVVAGTAIDVKNARHSLSSKGHYVEHCVPRFKLDRNTGQEVTTVGVLSEYRPAYDIVEGVGKCQILGEVSRQSLEKVIRWMQEKFGILKDINGIWNPGYQPGWVFEYPASFYRERPAFIRGISNQVNWLSEHGAENDEICGAQLVLCSEGGLPPNLKLLPEKLECISDLREIGRGLGFSRPALFLYVMARFLEAMIECKDVSVLATTLRDCLFICPDLLGTKLEEEECLSYGRQIELGQNNPLGLYDPFSYVFSLINILRLVAEEVKGEDLRLSSFRLPHPSILQGKTEKGTWITLVAYCGGWRKKPFKAKCGNTPLYLGHNQSCSTCGHLVCEKCGYCSKDCPAEVLRNSNENSEDTSNGRP